MEKFYHLSTCSTCNRIIKELGVENDAALQDIKTESISEDQLDQMANLAGSYEALFSRRAMKYKSMGLAEKSLNEHDYKKLILSEYTFLKRPVALINGKIFIGNSKVSVENIKAELNLV